MNLLNFMQFTHRFKQSAFTVIATVFFTFTFSMSTNSIFATAESFEEFDKRLSIYPPTRDDYLPVIEIIATQLDAIRQNSFDRAYFFYTSKEFKEKTSLLQFKSFIKENKVMSRNKSITLVEVYIDKNIGYYTGIISSKDGEVRTAKYQLIFENDNWKILGIQLLN